MIPRFLQHVGQGLRAHRSGLKWPEVFDTPAAQATQTDEEIQLFRNLRRIFRHPE
jgi:hypothetical protein